MKIYLKDIKRVFPEFEIRNYDENAYFTAFNHDSRNIAENDLFLPIVGERFDGHDFVPEALAAGASMSLCENSKIEDLESVSKPLILVDTVEEGLEKILNFSISSVTAPIVAITGSTGKTITKQMLVAILRENMKVLSEDNSNTVWGNSVILSKYVDEDAVVLECAMDRPGEIAWHVNSVDPDMGILLNVGYVHAEKLGGIEEIYREKKNLADYMERTGKPLILNIDDERLYRIKESYKDGSEIITFGMKEGANYLISDVSVDTEGTHFVFKYYDNTIPVNLKIFGDGYAYNAMAAIITANLLGVSMEKCVKSVEEFESHGGRFEILKYGENLVLVNDAYNSNPTSMEMSLKTFAKIYRDQGYQTIVVTGDMKELGSVSAQKHKEMGQLTKLLAFDEVYYVGDFFVDFGVGEKIDSADGVAAVLNEKLEKLNGRKVAILLKASHSIGLYQIPDFLKKLGVI